MIKPYLYLIKYTINKNSRHKEIFSVVKFQIDESNILDENKRIPVFMSFDKHDTLYRVVNIHNELTIRKVVI